MNIEIRPVGDKIRELRKALDLKQEDLVKHCTLSADREKTFTRNLVSMVETGKAPLTKNLADTIKNNILTACKDKNISCDFDFDEVFKTPEDQIIEHINNFSNIISKTISSEECLKYAERLIDLATEYDLLENLANLYLLVGELSHESDHNTAIKYYTAAYTLKNYLSSESQKLLIKNLKRTYIFLEQYESALSFSFKTIDPIEYEYKQCLFNDILSLKKLNRIDEAFDKINELNSLLSRKDKSLSIKLKILESNIYDTIGNFKKNIEINESLLKITEDSPQYIIILCNLIRKKTELGISTIADVEKLASLDIHGSLSPGIQTEILIGISYAYTPFNDEKSFTYLIRALETMIVNVSSTSILNQFNDVINIIFDNPKNIDFLVSSYYENFKLLMHTALEKELLNQKTLLKMIQYFLNKNENEFVKRLIERKIS